MDMICVCESVSHKLAQLKHARQEASVCWWQRCLLGSLATYALVGGEMLDLRWMPSNMQRVLLCRSRRGSM